MKLRIHGNSVRLRVTRSELDVLRQNGRVAETTEFPQGAAFTYSLCLMPASAEPGLQAAFSGSELRVAIPPALAQRWFDPQEVGIQGVQPLADGRELALLVEKDFPCLAPRPGEDESDAFSPPTGAEAGRRHGDC